jgi:hypothetical protein
MIAYMEQGEYEYMYINESENKETPPIYCTLILLSHLKKTCSEEAHAHLPPNPPTKLSLLGSSFLGAAFFSDTEAAIWNIQEVDRILDFILNR